MLWSEDEVMRFRKLTAAALLASVALIIFVIEAQIPPLTPVPGIKMGLANIVTVFTLYLMGPWYALAVVIVRVILGAFVTGQVSALLYSLSGGLAAWTVCAVLTKCFPQDQMWVVSVFGAVVHNAVQILVAVAVTGAQEIVWYLPVLVLSGTIAGVFTGLCAQFLIKRLKNFGISWIS